MKSWLSFGVCAGVSFSIVACGGSGNSGNKTGFDDDASTGGGSTGAGSEDSGPPLLSSDGGSGSGPSLGGSDGGGSSGSGCSAASQLVYVLSTSKEIYSFDPPSKTFTKISTLACKASGMTPNSMAVDRLGNAWVNYVTDNPITGAASAGEIFKVDIATGACATTNIKLSSGWYQLGMGYSTASATDQTDTLYVTATNSGGSGCTGISNPLGGGSTSAGLGSIDTTSGALKTIGPFSGNLAGESAELTGTGDGRLFGFFVLSPVQVAQIDKTGGATSNAISLAGVPCPMAWAFSFWGGDFYLYTSADGTTNSTVTHYTTADGGIDTSYVTNAGFVIVGAGVSTCAPTTPPAPK